VFEAAELNRKVSKKAYREAVPPLREALLQAQWQLLQEATFSVIVLIAGVDKGGKSETLNLFNEWLDPRYLENHALVLPTDEERERPYFWRFWRTLPPKGRIGIYCGSSWYSEPLLDHVYGRISGNDLDAQLIRIRRFEQNLASNGTLILKFWLHLNKQAQKERIRALERDPETRWRVSERDKKHVKLYDHFRAAAERALRETGTGAAPWVIVEGQDDNYRSLTCGEALHAALAKRLAAGPTTTAVASVPSTAAAAAGGTILGQLDLTKSVPKAKYRAELEHYQGRLNLLSRAAYREQVSTVVVLEGWDAAGKGGLIRRVTPAIDARHYRVISIAAPTEEERRYHYLWRFWRQLPGAGQVTLFDRSWYGRVLVERVEGFASEGEWRRAYAEIDDFEEQLVSHGMVVVKFWIHIDPQEQLARFKLRAETGYKQYKITDEDFRNREQWDAYEVAVNDMVERTSTDFAPWHLIEGNDKHYARIHALRILCQRLEERLGSHG
jgi:polyphosphate:AMP phosphotransferase